MADQVQVPFCVSGGITIAHPSFCQDKATHLIHTSIVGTIRLVPTTAFAAEALKKYEKDPEAIVTVCGYPDRSANCTHMNVYAVDLAEKFASKLSGMAGSG